MKRQKLQKLHSDFPINHLISKKKAAMRAAIGRTWSGMQYYTRAEDEKTLRYIRHKQEYSRVGGEQLWEEMEQQKVLMYRRSLSMRFRFQRKIMKSLESDKFLTEEERSFLRESHKSEGRRGKAGNQKTRAESSIRGRFTRGQKTKRQLSIKSILGWLGTSCGRTWKTRRLWRAGLH